MARRKRYYIPKVKGCYQCSQRRIDCDGTRPTCTKCDSRHIQCSGYGTYYRFRSGLKAKKERRPRSKHNLDTNPDAAPSSDPLSITASLQLINGTVTAQGNKKQCSVADPSPLTEFGQRSLFNAARKEAAVSSQPMFPEWVDPEGIEVYQSSVMLSGDDTSFHANFDTNCGVSREIDDILMALDWQFGNSASEVIHEERCTSVKNLSSIEQQPPTKAVFQASLIPVYIMRQMEPWKEYLLGYFSLHIAPQVVPLDDRHNGYRNLVLPIAHCDDLVLNAVATVSAFHLAGRGGARIADPTDLYSKTIRQLQRRSNLDDCGSETKQFVIVTIVLLLVGVMVNGFSDLPMTFHMLDHALQAIGGEDSLGHGDLSAFLVRQIHKLRVHAAPFISTIAGVQKIRNDVEKGFDCLKFYQQLYPEHENMFKLIASLRKQAYILYLDRVTDKQRHPSSQTIINNFKCALETAFPEGSIFVHVMLWASFIVAAECQREEDRRFFRTFLARLYHNSGFSNVPRGLELLEHIWSSNTRQAWPDLLPEPGVFIM